MSKPLIADPKRQAVASLRGYAYQIWQSLYAWLCLEENEILYLEGAEDYDVLGPGRAETVQVKDIKGSGSVTLNSQEVIDSIKHFWEHQSNNKGCLITFRFLTTADRGKERKPPFITAKGLDCWDACKKPNSDLTALKDFLSKKEALPDDLISFLTTGEDEEIREKLIERIIWDTGNEEKKFLEALIEKRVIAYGERFSILAPDSLSAIPRLLEYVFNTGCHPEKRSLEREDLNLGECSINWVCS
jgi:hypothetical protein